MTTNIMIKKRALEWTIFGIVLVFSAVVIVLTIYLVQCQKSRNSNCEKCPVYSKIYDTKTDRTLEICCQDGKTPKILGYDNITQCV